MTTKHHSFTKVTWYNHESLNKTLKIPFWNTIVNYSLERRRAIWHAPELDRGGAHNYGLSWAPWTEMSYWWMKSIKCLLIFLHQAMQWFLLLDLCFHVFTCRSTLRKFHIIFYYLESGTKHAVFFLHNTHPLSLFCTNHTISALTLSPKSAS